MVSVSVFGLGYVGAVTAACLAGKGHQVIGVDVNPAKCAALNEGRSPIIEAGVDELMSQGRRAGRIRATSDVAEALLASDVSFISVATPSLPNGKLDLRHVVQVCREIGASLRHKSSFHTIVMRSTVLPGTTETVVLREIEAASGKVGGRDFAVCMNPEFLREGTAVADFDHPPFTVLGASDPSHLKILRELYSSIPGRMFETTIGVAEMVKYVCNTFHAVKVAFANEIGTMCRAVDVDPFAVTDIFTADTKLNISTAYLTPGFAFGGSCLPKDVRALTYRAKELDVTLPLMQSVMASNAEHIERAAHAILNTGKRKVGVLGLSFKSGTDDLRESASVQLIKRLLGEGCRIQIWDKDVSLGRLIGSNRQYIEDVIPHVGELLCGKMEEVVAGAEVIVVGTKAITRETLNNLVRPEQIVIDLLRMELRPARVGATA